jgi:dihydrofolate reductase
MTVYKNVSMIAALGLETRFIGRDGQDIWQIPEDRKRFRKLTLGHPVIMGRKTWGAIPEQYRPLKDRYNILMTRDEKFPTPAGTFLALSLESAISTAMLFPGLEEIFIIGGAEIYKQALPYAQKLYLTAVDDPVEGDVRFPMYQDTFTKCTFEENHEHNGLKYTFLNLERA